MNVLYICPRFPYPLYRGDNVVIYNHIKFLSQNHKVTLLTFVKDDAEVEGIKELFKYCTDIEMFGLRPSRSIKNIIMAALRPEPLSVIRYYSAEMLKRSKELIESAKFDIVHTAFYYMGQYVVDKNIHIPGTTAVMLDTHNIEYLIYSRYATLARNPVLRFFAKIESQRIKRYETSIYKKFDRCIAFSELDKTNIVDLSGASNVVVNPACIEVAQSPVATAYEEADYVAFFGLLNTFANDDAIRFFYEQILPFIKKDVPDIQFIIGGKNPTRYVSNLARDSKVRILGVIPNVREFLERIAVVVVPLRLGGGIRIKILDSWAAHKAVVSTSIGAEGVQICDGTDIAIADSAKEFASAVSTLLNDKNKRRAMGEAAFKKVSEYYDPDKIMACLNSIYRAALEEKKAHARDLH